MINQSLWKVAGGHSNKVNCYAGGIDLNFSKEKLLGNIQGYLDAGFKAVKIKVGKKDYREDVERVSAVRELSNKAFTVVPGATVPPGPGEVRLDVGYVGICGTDMHIFHGLMYKRVNPPQITGHEMSGTVA